MDVLGIHITVFEDEVAAHGLDAGFLEIGGPFRQHFGGMAVVEPSADGRISMSGHFHVAGQRACPVQRPPHHHGRGDLKIRPQHVESPCRGEELHIRSGGQRHVRVPLGDHGAALHLDHLDAGVTSAGHVSVDEGVEPFGERATDRRREVCGKRRPDTFFPGCQTVLSRSAGTGAGVQKQKKRDNK